MASMAARLERQGVAKSFVRSSQESRRQVRLSDLRASSLGDRARLAWFANNTFQPLSVVAS